MIARFQPGFVVQQIGDPTELSVQRVGPNEGVFCAWFTEERLHADWFPASALELIDDRVQGVVEYAVGDRVQLPSGGPILTVDGVGKAGIRCIRFHQGDFHRHCFARPSLWLTKPTHDKSARFDLGDMVRLQGSGPEMMVVYVASHRVRCRYGDKREINLDARALELNVQTGHEIAAQALIAVGRQYGVDLSLSCSHDCFFNENRFINLWQKSRAGVVYYAMQGKIAVLPHAFKDSQSSFYGMWAEAGFVADVEQAFHFLKAWLIDGKEVDELPPTSKLRYGIGFG